MRLPSLRRVVNSTSSAMHKLQYMQIRADFYDNTVSSFYPDTGVARLNSVLHKKKNHHEMQEKQVSFLQ
jgi:hypothetical protein